MSIYTKADALAPHVKQAKENVYLGEKPSLYADKDAVLKVCGLALWAINLILVINQLINQLIMQASPCLFMHV